MAKHIIKLLMVSFLIVPFTVYSANSLVRNYFNSQGFNYPVHLKLPIEFIPKLVGPDLDERPAPEYTELFHEGVEFLKNQVSIEFLQEKAHPEAVAFVLSDPFLMQSSAKAGYVSFAVNIDAYIETFNKNKEIFITHKILKVGRAEILKLSNIILFEKEVSGWKCTGFTY